MAGISTFFTAYSALLRGEPVEVVAVGVTEGHGDPRHYYVVVDERGASSIAQPDELELFGVSEDASDAEPAGHDDAMAMLKAIATAFDEHDLDAIMVRFADDAVFEGPSGTDAWGTRFVGRDAVREAFAARFSGIPDVRYRQDEHFVDGDRGASEWTLSGTTTEGQWIEVRGCDLWTFRDRMVVKKDSYWKIRTTH